MKKQKFSSSDVIRLRSFEYLFFTWLTANDLCFDFCICLHNSGYRGSVRSYIDRFFNDPSRSLSNLISCAFIWSRTPQGYRFWRKVSADWNRHLDSFINSLK